MDIVGLAIRNARLTISLMLFLTLAGALAYRSIPKEAEPDVQIPIIYVSMSYSGISPEDSERLLLRPMETRLKTIANVKEMTAKAYQGGGNVVVEFQAGSDLDQALEDVRNKVADAEPDLPEGADEPTVNEVNLSEFPVLVVTLSGDVPERELTQAARELRDRVEEVPGVLEAALKGVRDDLVEVIIDPMRLSSYGLQLDQVIAGVGANNSLVAAGSIEGSEGRYAIKIPALIETAEDVGNLPIVAGDNAVVRARDLATVRATFKDPETITRVNGQPAIAIEVSKRTGANLIETVDAVKAVAMEAQSLMPEGAVIGFSQDKSTEIRQLLTDLQNSVLTAVVLVFIVILFALSGRAAILIGLAIPVSFLIGILGLSLAGLTVNIVVLFSLILAVGMLVDDAIIVTEFAERRMTEGMPRDEAFALAARRMAGPVIAATLTRIAAFSPLLFWPGIVGEFMKYMPMTLIATLSASMLYALVFTPTLGALFAKPVPHHESPDGLYMRLVGRAVRHPALVLTGRDRAARRGAAGLRPLRLRGGVLPQRRARLRPALRPRPGQPLDRREGRPGAAGRGAHGRLAEHQVGLYPGRGRRRTGRRGCRRGCGRGHPVRVRRLARARERRRDPRPASRRDDRHPRRRHRGLGPERRSADRQGDPGPALRRRPGRP